jgi:hypothetical protein
MMRAGLQRNIGRRSPRFCSGLRQRHNFGMRAATRLRPSTPDNPAVFHDHAADSRIWPGSPLSTTPQAQRKSQIPGV